jgi:hypothetical protein
LQMFTPIFWYLYGWFFKKNKKKASSLKRERNGIDQIKFIMLDSNKQIKKGTSDINMHICTKKERKTHFSC